MDGVNRQIVLAARPVGLPKETDFRLVESAMPRPRPGEVLVRALYLSVDPYMRGRIRQNGSYSHTVQIGEVMVGGIVGRVVESNDPRLAAGDLVEGMLGWQEYAISTVKALRRIDPDVAPAPTWLYVLGMPGMTAYFGLLDICRPQPGETVVVSGAGGAVGSLVGQIAKIKRCRAIGIAGSDEKVRYVTQTLGFDAAFNYKGSTDYYAKLKELCPTGIDVYFDNVGGPITDAVMQLINTKARVAVCGQISEYNSEQPEMGPRWLHQLVIKQAKVEGFLVFQYADRYDEALKQLTTWLREGRLKHHEDVMDGLENAPKAFIRMLKGENLGKQLVKIGE
ncbi:MAG TPA: NADP-dependent oxidoreductase [Bryobacteraceae bacterium]|nr:NADP-dependent oxidoreductase [Bryobacteraceae bacterium]